MASKGGDVPVFRTRYPPAIPTKRRATTFDFGLSRIVANNTKDASIAPGPSTTPNVHAPSTRSSRASSLTSVASESSISEQICPKKQSTLIQAVSHSVDGTDAIRRVINEVLGDMTLSDLQNSQKELPDVELAEEAITDSTTPLGNTDIDENEAGMDDESRVNDVLLDTTTATSTRANATLPFATLQLGSLTSAEAETLTNFVPVERFDTPETLEEVCTAGTNGTKLHDFYVALGVYCISHPLSDDAYSALVELLQLVDDISLLQNMPRSQKTTRSWLDSRIPIPRIFRKEVTLDKRKVGQKEGIVDPNIKHYIYMFDDREKIRSFLFDDSLRKDMHFGMGYRSLSARNLWEGTSWHQGIRVSASGRGNYPRYGNHKDGFILQSDFITTIERQGVAPVTGRVVELFEDRQNGSPTFGLTVASVEPIATFDTLPPMIQAHCVKSGYIHGVGCDMFLVENPK